MTRDYQSAIWIRILFSNNDIADGRREEAEDRTHQTKIQKPTEELVSGLHKPQILLNNWISEMAIDKGIKPSGAAFSRGSYGQPPSQSKQGDNGSGVTERGRNWGGRRSTSGCGTVEVVESDSGDTGDQSRPRSRTAEY